MQLKLMTSFSGWDLRGQENLLAVVMAVAALKRRSTKIILTRPAVEAGESLAFTR